MLVNHHSYHIVFQQASSHLQTTLKVMHTGPPTSPCSMATRNRCTPAGTLHFMLTCAAHNDVMAMVPGYIAQLKMSDMTMVSTANTPGKQTTNSYISEVLCQEARCACMCVCVCVRVRVRVCAFVCREGSGLKLPSTVFSVWLRDALSCH